MNLLSILEALNVSDSNKANVKCILKKLFDKLETKEINKRTLNDTTKIINIVKTYYSYKKRVEVVWYIYKINNLINCKIATVEKYQKAIKELKLNHLANYNKNREYIEDTYEQHRETLKQFLTHHDYLTRRIAHLSYYLGGTRKGELLNCRVSNFEEPPNEQPPYNCFNIFDSKLYIFHHKTKARCGTRIIDIPSPLLNEARSDLNQYLLQSRSNASSTKKPISSNTYQKIFKSMLNINPLDFRHLHAVNNTTKPPHTQQEEANKLGHSLTTSHFIYANGLTNKTITKELVQEAKKYYKQLKKEYEAQQNNNDKFTIHFD